MCHPERSAEFIGVLIRDLIVNQYNEILDFDSNNYRDRMTNFSDKLFFM
jgi:hypothetical protein